LRLPPPLASYSSLRSLRDDLVGNGLSASSPGRLLLDGMAASEGRRAVFRCIIDKAVEVAARRLEVAALLREGRLSPLPYARPKVARMHGICKPPSSALGGLAGGFYGDGVTVCSGRDDVQRMNRCSMLRPRLGEYIEHVH